MDLSEPRVENTQLFYGRCIGILVLMHKNMFYANKTMVLFELGPYVFQSATTIKGRKTSTFFLSMHWVFDFHAKNPN